MNLVSATAALLTLSADERKLASLVTSLVPAASSDGGGLRIPELLEVLSGDAPATTFISQIASAITIAGSNPVLVKVAADAIDLQLQRHSINPSVVGSLLHKLAPLISLEIESPLQTVPDILMNAVYPLARRVAEAPVPYVAAVAQCPKCSYVYLVRN